MYYYIFYKTLCRYINVETIYNNKNIFVFLILKLVYTFNCKILHKDVDILFLYRYRYMLGYVMLLYVWLRYGKSLLKFYISRRNSKIEFFQTIFYGINYIGLTLKEYTKI